ncbi:extracellular solute-binding protein [Streptomyces humi]|uniref:extracellular solute-binding protein n=1 Tax=Streptomyces humi TaxID=1428620 RepID=UPI0006289A05|nr:extracellular solute-binding protein [Streptomyces humi]
MISPSCPCLQELARAGAFGDNASSVTYDQGAATALLYTGKAGMELMGTWEYANIVKAAPDFAKKDLGYLAFPALSGGKGDAKDIVGNPSNFLSLGTPWAPRRRRAAVAAVTVMAALGLAACGSSGPSATSSSKGLTMWALASSSVPALRPPTACGRT